MNTPTPSELLRHIALVRAAWRRTEVLKAAAVLCADAVLVILALVAIDALYHLPQHLRLAALLCGLAVLAIATLVVLIKPLKRQISDDDLALYVETRFPELKGSLIAAVEYGRRPAADGIHGELADALTVDCLQRMAKVEPSRIIDKQRLMRRAAIGGALLLFLLGAAAVKPSFFTHQFARVLTPWNAVAPSPAELQREREEEEQRRLIEEAARPKLPPKIELRVAPGSTDLPRGGALAVRASVNRSSGPVTLKFRSAGGPWRPLQMPEDPQAPDTFARSLPDITEDLEYQVEMAGMASDVFAVKVYDPAQIKALKLTYRFPKYTGLPEKTVSGMDGNIEAVEGTTVDVTLVASTALKTAQLNLNGQKSSMRIAGAEASTTLQISADGDYALSATDARGAPLASPSRFIIKAIRDDPPKLEVVYPSIDTEVHPMEEIAFAAKAEDSVGLKEVRLHYYYNHDKEVILKVPCIMTAAAIKEKLAELTVPLEERSAVKPGDTLLFHFEAEDLKGQITASDMYTVSVRPLVTWAAYGYHPEAPPHAYAGPELINVIGAAWDLATKRKKLTPEKFKTESEKIGHGLETPGN